MYYKEHFFGSQSERCGQRSCVVCPQADVICTCGALYVAEPHWLVYVVAPEGRVVTIVVIVALVGLVVLGARGRINTEIDKKV